MKRLSWITFVFLPLMFIASLFGMNVDVLGSNPAWWIYVPFATGTMFLTLRLAFIALFSAGVFVIVAVAVRIYYLDVALRQTYDVMREGAHVWAWVPVEANLVIMFECVPWLKPLVKTWRGGAAAVRADYWF
ncbi:hypothetical protein P885DRAFT_81219 [Corynascus similis CBS 632.67]